MPRPTSSAARVASATVCASVSGDRRRSNPRVDCVNALRELQDFRHVLPSYVIAYSDSGAGISAIGHAGKGRQIGEPSYG